MRVQWYGQSGVLARGRADRVHRSVRPAGRGARRARARVQLRADRERDGGSAADHARARRPQRGRGDRRRAGDDPVDRGAARIAGRRGGRRSRRSTTTSPEPMRGPNTIFRFALDGVARSAHLGDFGQPALRAEQRAAIGEVDVLFVPVGDGPTIGGEPAVALVRSLAPRLVVPMHYRTAAVNFLEPPDAFLAALGAEVTPARDERRRARRAARHVCCSSGGAVRAAARVTRESGSPAANQVHNQSARIWLLRASCVSSARPSASRSGGR